MKCKTCGKEINAIDAFCKHCGAVNREQVKPVKELEDTMNKSLDSYDSTGYKVPENIGNDQNDVLAFIASILSVAAIMLLFIQNTVTIALSFNLALASIVLSIIGLCMYKVKYYKNRCIITIIVGIIYFVMLFVTN